MLGIEKKFKDLLSKIKDYNPSADLEIVERAWKFSKLAHTGQRRLTGELFINHPLEVGLKLANWKLDTTSIVAVLLHDTIEDGGARREDLVSGLGEDAATLVDGVTKVTSLRLRGSREEEFVENLRKMLLVMGKDLRVILVKLADRMHNMETLSALSVEMQLQNAQETLEIYAPLAERLGMGEARGELEDLAFPFIYPSDYKTLKKKSVTFYKEAEKHIEYMKKVLLKSLRKEGIKAEICARKKHLYSLWRKLERPEIDWNFNKIHDIVALRILVDTTAHCYSALGVVHSVFRPVPHIGVSDFIAQPKPNGYRSIHTKVFGPGASIAEIQIRTYEMNKEAESGIAAHWAYEEVKAKGAEEKELEEKGGFAPSEKLSWVRQLVDWQREITDTKEFLKAVKFDALKHRNFIFSPNGDVYDLPAGATPVDFTYAVHTEMGKYIAGAKVDDKMVPLNYQLQSGQVVEILKFKNPKEPNSRWLEFVVTTLARREISRYLRKKSKVSYTPLT